MALEAGFFDIEPHELAEFLLRETGQKQRDAINPPDLLDYLKLKPVLLDLERALPPDRKARGVLSFGDRIIGVHSGLIEQRARFTVLHEVAHYILPHHQNRLYVCSAADLSLAARQAMEREANELAAELLFQGDRFTLEANSHPLTAATVKLLALKYKASYESTAWRMVERNFQPCMFVAFERVTDLSVIAPDKTGRWVVRYCVASAAFSARFFATMKGDVPEEIVAQVTRPDRDIADAVECELAIPNATGTEFPVHAQFFFNSYNIFALLRPVEQG